MLAPRVASGLVVLLVVLAGPRDAAANMAAPPPASQLGPPGSTAARTPLVVRAADLVIDCAAGAPTCQLEATYVVHNPGAVRAGGVAAFYALRTDDVTVTVDGRPSGRELGEPEKAGFDEAVAAAAGESAAWSRSWDSSRHGFELSLDPGAEARVVVRGRLVLRERRRSYGYGMSAGRARHVVLGGDEASVRGFALAYLVAPLRTWGAWPDAMTFTLRHPAAWRADTSGGISLAERREGDTVVRQGTIAADTVAFQVDLVFDDGEAPAAGVLLGVGGLVDDAVGTVLRAGGEIAFGESWLASVVLDLELGGETGLTVAPVLAYGTPWVIIIPALSLGVGVPVRLLPDVLVGARLELDLHLGPLGLATAFDYYPGASGPRELQVTMLFQLGL